MSAPSILAIMQGIETRLETISGLQVFYYSPGSITPPTAIIGLPSIPNYFLTFGRGHWSISPTVTVLVSAAMDKTGQEALAAYANHTGSLSIAAAIDGDGTLGGIVEYCNVTDFRPLGMEEVGQVGYYGGIFGLEVGAQGT